MHNIIVGASFSGKTNLAKFFANQAHKKGEDILVFDPRKSGGWPDGAKKYSSPEKFLNDFWKLEKHHVFIDEAKVLFDFDIKGAEKIAYQGRHNGHLVYFIGQRAMSMIPPNARNQCGKVFAFKQSKKDSDTLADEYNDILSQCVTLKKVHFIFSDGFACGKAKLVFETKENDSIQKPPKIEVLKNE
ncbi:MAG: hypothetical protein V6Z82_06980 [Flavobacteriales bacterium]